MPIVLSMGVFKKMTLMSTMNATQRDPEQHVKRRCRWSFGRGPCWGKNPRDLDSFPLVLPMTARKRQKCGQSGLHHAELLERELTLGLAQPPARLDEIEARAGPRLKRNARQSLCFTSQIARALRRPCGSPRPRRRCVGPARICTVRVASGGLQTLQRLIGLRTGVAKGAVACAPFEERDGKHARDRPRLVGLANGRRRWTSR